MVSLANNYIYFAEQDALLRATYETGPMGGEAMDQHLWTYRQRVSLEHLRLIIQEASLRKEFPILHNFLQIVSTSNIITFV